MKHPHLLRIALGIAAAAGSSVVGIAQPPLAGYTATLEAMNQAATRSEASGEALFSVDGDILTIDIRMQGAPPDIPHRQQIHGFADGREAACPGAKADMNGDGVVDAIEAEKSTGIVLVPLDAHPARMEGAHGSYPEAGPDGRYHYRSRVSLRALKAAFRRTFPGQSLDLEKRVIIIRGVPPDERLPDSVASLGPVPAHTTLPIACGRIARMDAR